MSCAWAATTRPRSGTRFFDPFRVGVGASTHAARNDGYGLSRFQQRGLLFARLLGSKLPRFFYQGMAAFGENGAGPDRQDGNLYGLRVGYGGTN